MRRAVRTTAAAAIGAAALIAAVPGTASALVAPQCESYLSHLSCYAIGSSGPLTWTDVLGSGTTLTYQTADNHLYVACNPLQLNTVSYTDSTGQTSGSTTIRCNPGPPA